MNDLLLGHTIYGWIASWANPACDTLFRTATTVGSTPLYFVCLAPLFWVADRRRAVVLFFLLALSSYLNTFLKLWFHMPRPDPNILRALGLHPGYEASFGFPSGHTQNAVVFWGYLAWWIGRSWAWIGAAAMVGLIGFSRLYLGVHFPLDVLGGLALGSAHFALAPLLERWSAVDFRLPALGWAALMAVAVAVLVTTLDPAMAALSGSMLGLSVAVWIFWPPYVAVAGTAALLATVVAGLIAMGATVALVLAPLGTQSTLVLGAAMAAAWVVSVALYPRAVRAVASRT
ncbi:MAG: phosphatase PAP2 family protein [Deltaproteobacteria bacterium]|nr:phosphatase PAP2 family protein [Deltaproteobacteria bacterium]